MEQTTTTDSRIIIDDVVPEKYIFHKTLQGDQAKEIYEAVKSRVDQDFQDVPAFDRHFEFNEETGLIEGSSTLYGILINDELESNGLWLPTIDQAVRLESEYAKTSDVYRDWGAAVYGSGNPNQKVATKLLKESGLETPILFSIRNLRLEKGDDLLGVNIGIKNSQGIISGEEAMQYLADHFNYQGDSGACRVCRSRSGDRDASWSWFDDSYDAARVDIVSGEATPQNLEGAVLKDIQRLGELKVQEMNAKIGSAYKSASEILNR